MDINQVNKYFKFDHLPQELQKVSAPFKALAQSILEDVPEGLSKTIAFQKLLEAKDAAVRGVAVDKDGK